MQTVRFIHAADLHLDTAFSGLARVSHDLAQRLHESTFVALERLMALCAQEKPDFLLLAGDIYNQEEISLRAQLTLRNACEDLAKLGIKVFLAHGNHDPLPSRLKTLAWPDNVTIFGPEVTAVRYFKPGSPDRPAAIIHGVSHSGPEESRNLAAWYQRTKDLCPQIGILHTSLGSKNDDAMYAPASIEDLVSAHLDYWALGHAHEYTVICQDPLVIYPGATQGLHINETGAHGCVLVELISQAAPDSDYVFGEIKFRQEFVPLAPVGWESVEIDLSVMETEEPQAKAGGKAKKKTEGKPVAPEPKIDALQPSGQSNAQACLPKLERLIWDKLADLPRKAWPGCQDLIVRLRLTGKTGLDAELRRISVQNELMEAMQEGMPGEDVRIWFKDIIADTRPLFEREAALGRQDLLGEVLRQGDHWRKKAKLLNAGADQALGDLYLKGRSHKGFSQPRGNDLLLLLDEAERLCADFLEND